MLVFVAAICRITLNPITGMSKRERLNDRETENRKKPAPRVAEL